MPNINLNNVSFPGDPPGANMTGVTIRWRLTSDPDVIGSYTTHTNAAVILTNGNFQGAPIVIPVPDYNTSYTVWVFTTCGNGAKKAFVTPAASCVDVTDMDGTVSE